VAVWVGLGVGVGGGVLVLVETVVLGVAVGVLVEVRGGLFIRLLKSESGPVDKGVPGLGDGVERVINWIACLM